MRRLVMAILFAALGAATPGAENRIFSVEEAAGCLGLSPQQLDDVRAGKIVSTDYNELTDKELAITAALLVDRPIAEVARAVRESGLLEADPNVMSFKLLGDKDPAESDFAGIELGADEAGEIRKLYAAKPGSDLNLGTAEIARLAALRAKFPGACDKDPACAAAVTQEYRRALLDRMRAYRSGGTQAIAGYARDGGKSAEPGEELRTALQGCAAVERLFPGPIQAFRNYPKDHADGVESRFFWVKQRVQDRPDFILMQRMLYERADGFLGVERQFYVGHSYNSLTIMSGCLPTGSKTLVFYINRTSTDQVAGFAKDTRHSLGRRHMRAEVLKMLETVRSKFAVTASPGGR